MQNEAENPYFPNQKFFTTLTSFLPSFFYIEVSILAVIVEFCEFSTIFIGEKKGVKN